ncbi:MAG: malto-oligosyltrehalose trehalohydrolase [Nitriliruptorales bacterium]|nr:malto-oligosyltrehalose trehalohydrolase [Nitriliruptorales bacterium]
MRPSKGLPIDTRAHGPGFHGDGTVTFRVWAPAATQVTLDLDGAHADLVPHAHGWHELRLPAEHGQDYGYMIDGGPLRPDPASRWQPDGVHAASRLFDPNSVASPDAAVFRAAPISSAVIYELHIGTVTPEGTFDAATRRLAQLADLGVTHVEVMPINAFNGTRGWGYDGVAWYAAHEPYGGPQGFARFVHACHSRGLGVILDVVYNHLGPIGNYLPDFGPYLTDLYRTPWGGAVNLDGPDSDPVRAFIVGNAVYWLSTFGVDGLRLDAVHALIDMSSVHILAELSEAVAALSVRQGRPLALVAESDRNDPQTIRRREVGGMGLDAQWADDLHHALHTAVTGEHDGYYVDYGGLIDVAGAYQRGFVYDGHYSVHRRRTVGAPLHDVPGYRLVTSIQNHDQVGNRAVGDRLTTLVAPELVEVAIVLLCASPTTPMLFMGEEYGETNPFQYFTSHPEQDVADAVRAGRREEFAAFAAFSGGPVPDPQDPATMERSRLDWSRADTPPGRARQDLWRRLLQLRRDVPALRNGRRDLVEVLAVDDERLALLRRDEDGSGVLVVANLSDQDWHLALPDARWRLLLDTGRSHDAAAEPEGEHETCVHGRSASLWSMDTAGHVGPL